MLFRMILTNNLLTSNVLTSNISIKNVLTNSIHITKQEYVKNNSNR